MGTLGHDARPIRYAVYVELIEEDIARHGFTEREAIAAAVDELDFEANSFDAACSRFKELLQAYRATLVGENPG